jgi:hypothetical protein
MNHSEIANFLWSVADLIRDTAPRPLEAIGAGTRTFKQDIVRISAGVTVGRLR